MFEPNSDWALTEPSLSLQQRELVGMVVGGCGGGQAVGVCLHTEACCVPRSFQHMAEALKLTKEKKKSTSTKKKKTLEKYLALGLGAGL